MDDRVESGRSAQAGGASDGSGSFGAGQQDAGAILTLVCFKCGTEYYFAEGSEPSEITCAKCGNGVFRRFVSQEGESEDMNDFEDATRRDLRTDDAEGETLPGDILDLDRG